MNLEKIAQYRLIRRETLTDIHTEGYLLEHRKTHARVLVLENDDENKVFNIAFRTPPADSKGVAHIVEHTVLCGSREFPTKDPFVELVKGSLNTFLNAMTYPDKTMYPLASCNDTDFCNLMHVYLDAVFYPNIYKKEAIFRQEGWSYELESPDADLTYNGVVYNEMKGAFSSPEEVLEREIMNTLFPDTPYGVESGGDPDCIPQLTYEQYLDFHRKYYHPSNSYIYLYGDMDFEERLNWIDEHYLSQFDALSIDSEIPMQQPFDEMRHILREYPVAEEDPVRDATYLTYNVVVGTSLDVELSNAFAVLDYALLSSPGAVLKQALLDAGIGTDIMSSYESGILQPTYSIIAKNANAEDEARFVQIIRKTLEETAEHGIDKKALLAGINTMEFKAREADYGAYPKGLMYGLDVFDSWLYDAERPFDYLRFDVYAQMKEDVKTGYFEELIRKYLLNNTHGTILTAVPKRGLTAEKDALLAEKLQTYKASLSGEEVLTLVEKTKQLKAFQEAPQTPEELRLIPMLKREDIGKKAAGFQNAEYEWEGVKILHHDVFSNGIAYLDVLFDIGRVAREDIPYLGVLKAVLGMVNTEHYTYQELNNEINGNTGGISAGLSMYPKKGENAIRAFAGIRASVLYEKLPYAYQMAEEIALHSKFDDDRRMYEILTKLKSRLSMQLAANGHRSAGTRALSYFSQFSAFGDAVGGIGFYQLIADLVEHFEEKKDALRAKLQELTEALFCKEGLFVSLTCDADGLEAMREPFTGFYEALPCATAARKENTLVLSRKNEGFTTAGQVQYVARAGNFAKEGFAYTGLLQIVKVMMNYDYLWQNIRVLGGAYGCMSAFGRGGDTMFVSYRDPKLAKTNEVYDGIPAYLEQFEADEREMTKYIIGTISELDTPLTPSMKGSRSLNAYFCEITEEEVQKERDEILNATCEQIRALASQIRAVLAQQNLCVIGNEQKIRESKELFERIAPLC